MRDNTVLNAVTDENESNPTLLRTINGASVSLRSPRPGDAPRLFRTYFSDSECSHFLARSRHTIEIQTARLLIELSTSFVAYDGKSFAWVIECRQRHAAVGLVICIPEGTAIQIHYGLAKENWGRGLATEAVKLACDELFRTGRFDRIFTTCAAEHASSRAVLEKSGFEQVAYLPGALVLPALGHDPKDGVQYARYRARCRAPIIQFPLPVSG